MADPPERVVAVFGSGQADERGEAFAQARDVGRKLAELGYAVANGGYGGTMAASARGAREAGGQTIGVVCSIWRSRPNPYVQRVVRTADLAERVRRLVELAPAGCVVLPGATGTLAELAWVWERVSNGLMPRRPIVFLGAFWAPLIEMMAAARPASADAVALVESAEDLARHFPPPDVG